MVEEICPEAAAAANDGEAVDGSSSPNQTSRRAPAARRIDPLEMSVKVHTVEHTGDHPSRRAPSIGSEADLPHQLRVWRWP